MKRNRKSKMASVYTAITPQLYDTILNAAKENRRSLAAQIQLMLEWAAAKLTVPAK